ncbi:hypothetical protein [Devosia sp. 2618]|uniref:hypothetical protein n=1 Tax=Devosia sp. 2618 TaxID=3156454 RepID=UPI00339682F4
MKVLIRAAVTAFVAIGCVAPAVAQISSPLKGGPLLDDRALNELRLRIGRTPGDLLQRQGRGCTLYEHVNYKGQNTRLMATQLDTGTFTGEEYLVGRFVFFGNEWNDRASSATCDTACGALLYEHREMKGQWMPVPATNFGQLNDVFSSAVVFCRTN